MIAMIAMIACQVPVNYKIAFNEATISLNTILTLIIDQNYYFEPHFLIRMSPRAISFKGSPSVQRNKRMSNTTLLNQTIGFPQKEINTKRIT